MRFLVVFRDLDGNFAGHQEVEGYSEARRISREAGGEMHLNVALIEEFQAIEKLNYGKTCGQMFGPELLLPGMEPGTGIRNCCLLFEGHLGSHCSENPKLDTSYLNDLYADWVPE